MRAAYWGAYQAELERLDARQCKTGYACGSACISLAKDCRKEPRAATGRERLRRISELASGNLAEGRGLARLRQGEAAGKLQELQNQRSQRAQELIGQRQQRKPVATEPPAVTPGTGSSNQRQPGRQPDEAPNAATQRQAETAAVRTKSAEPVVFDKPLVGPSGAQLLSYHWEWKGGTKYSAKEGGDVDARVSDWDKSGRNEETGRSIVHKFGVQMPDGTVREVSAESAVKLLGFGADTEGRKQFNDVKGAARSVAKLQMKLYEQEQKMEALQKDWAEVRAMPTPTAQRGQMQTEANGRYQYQYWSMGDQTTIQRMKVGDPPFQTDAQIREQLEGKWRQARMKERGWAEYDTNPNADERLSTERSSIRAKLKKAQAKLQAATTATQSGAVETEASKPSVKVEIRRAKPGGEYGPDGHWYAGGAWMSQGKFVGAQSFVGEGEGADASQKAKGKSERVRIIRNRAPEPPPTEPKGVGLPAPKGLGKRAQAIDDEMFDDKGFLTKEGRRLVAHGAVQVPSAVAQRMTEQEMQWVIGSARKKLLDDPKALDDFDHYSELSKTEAEYNYDNHGRGGKFKGVSKEKYVLANQMLEAIFRMPLSASKARRLALSKEYESTVQFRSGEKHAAWILNNVFRAVQLRRERGGSSAFKLDSAYADAYFSELLTLRLRNAA